MTAQERLDQAADNLIWAFLAFLYLTTLCALCALSVLGWAIR